MTGKKIMEKEFKLKKRKITFEMRKTTLKEKLEFLLAIVIIAVIMYWLKKQEEFQMTKKEAFWDFFDFLNGVCKNFCVNL